MKLARSRRRAICAFAGLAAAYAAPALAYDDKSTITSVMDLVGVSTETDARSIDYSERPKLVLPPSRSADVLPAPRESVDRPDGWPSNAPGTQRKSDRFGRVAGAPPDPKKPGLLERVRGPAPTAAPGTDDEPGLLQRVMSARARSAANEPDEPARRQLTEPPDGYRHPTQALGSVRDTDAKKTSWWNPLSYMGGGGNDNDPVAQPGSVTPAQQASGGGGLSSLMPSFLRGSDKN